MLDWKKEHCGSSHRREVPRVKVSGILLYKSKEDTVAVVSCLGSSINLIVFIRVISMAKFYVENLK